MADLADDGHGYGESYVLNPNGQIVAGARLYDEYLMGGLSALSSARPCT